MKQSAAIIMLLLCTLASRAQHQYKEISLPDLVKKTQKATGGYVILDVRSPGEYLDTGPNGAGMGIGRIKTAINVPIQDLFQKPETIKNLEKYKQDEIYVICSHSYRSRRVSDLLTQNGFTHVNNVQGGMTEWYRNDDELAKFRPLIFENNVAYHNLSPAGFYKMLLSDRKVELIGFNNPPRFYFDSLLAPYITIFPGIKNTVLYTMDDSLAILEKIKVSPDQDIILYNIIGSGSAETAAWLATKGYKNVYNVVGGLSTIYEYLVNYQSNDAQSKMLKSNSSIRFYTPLSFCHEMPSNVQWIDLRHDTTFNQVTHGTKLDYRMIKGSLNFPYYKTADEFTKQFPDKKKLYMINPEQGYKGVELATALVKKGYRVGWLIGGDERWEWYTNNIVEFECKDYLVN